MALLALALLVAGAPALADGARASKLHGIVPPENPVTNIAPSPNYNDCSASGRCSAGPPCYSATFGPQFSSTSCEQAELAAIDNARAKEGVGPVYLPSDFNALSGVEQLLVVIDLERVGRGLPPIKGIVASMDTVAQAGTQVAGARPGTFEDPSFPRGFSLGARSAFAYRCHAAGGGYACDRSGQPGAAIAAGGEVNVLDADYGWMYDDGFGGSNYACQTRGAAGCWGHRDNILGRYPTQTRFVISPWGASLSMVPRRRTTLVMGAGALQPNGAGPQGNYTAIFAAIVGRPPPFLYTWRQALAAGANARPT